MQFNRKSLYFLFSFFLSLRVFAQGPPEPVDPPAPAPKVKQPEIYEMVDEPAQYPGGFSALRTFLAANLVYSEQMIADGYTGKYYVKFIVDKDGTCRDFSIIKVTVECTGCDKEVLRVLRLMPKWKPGLVNGEPVSSWFRLPVTFGPK